MKSKIILGHPFAGSLYMFFEQQMSDYPFKEPINHPYYRDLFGRSYNYWKDLAFTLFAIFDEIILPPADAYIPDYDKYSSNGIYYNKELGIYTSWNDFFTDEIHEQVKKDLEDPFIQKLLLNYPSREKEGILSYIRLYIKLSKKHNCPVLCGGTYQEIFTYLVNTRNCKIDNETTAGNSVSFTQNYLEASVAAFNISSIDSLYEIKSDRDIKTYAKNFQRIIMEYGNNVNMETEIRELLKFSLFKDSFYKKVASILDTSSIICSAVGLIPLIGLPFSVASVAESFISSNLKRNKYNWYQLVYSIDRIDKETKIKLL